MSWMATDEPRDRRRKPKKAGRRKEEGGHRRIDVSVDKLTGAILQIPENMSKYVEYCVNTATFSRRIRFQEPNMTLSDESGTFKTAAVFEWVPLNSSDNAITSIACYFKHRCEGRGFKFRLVVNGNHTSVIEVSSSDAWALSYVYRDIDFADRIRVLPNQSSYTIEFQFSPQGSSDIAYVKYINVILDVVDGLPPLSP